MASGFYPRFRLPFQCPSGAGAALPALGAVERPSACFSSDSMSRIIRSALDVARYAWALPATCVGLLLSLIAFALGAKVRLVEGAIEIAGGRIDSCLSMLPRCSRFGAITFGHVIIGVDHETLSLHRSHEHVHVRQYERWGVLFFPLYLASSLLQIVRGRDPYLNNSFEREAFAKSACPERLLVARAARPTEP